MRDGDWVSAHIFYHDHLDHLLVGLVAQLVEELAVPWFFLRYWDGGNHLRLRLLADPRDHHAIRARVRERCAAFFRARPAPDRVLPEEYAAQAARLAAIERVPTYATRPHPNNSVAFIPYRREYDRYGAGIDAVELHFAESSRLALRQITASPGPSAGPRDTAALCLILLSWLCDGSSPAPEQSPFAVAAVNPTEAEAGYLRQAGTLCQIAARMRALASHGTDAVGDGALAAWTRSVSRLRNALGGGAAATAVLDVCGHLACNRLGVLGTGEAYLRYLAARALAEVEANGRRRVLA